MADYFTAADLRELSKRMRAESVRPDMTYCGKMVNSFTWQDWALIGSILELAKVDISKFGVKNEESETDRDKGL